MKGWWRYSFHLLADRAWEGVCWAVRWGVAVGGAIYIGLTLADLHKP